MASELTADGFCSANSSGCDCLLGFKHPPSVIQKLLVSNFTVLGLAKIALIG